MTAAQRQQRRRDKAKALARPALDLMTLANPKAEAPMLKLTPKMTALVALRERALPDAVRPQSDEESQLTITLCDELTNLAMGRGLGVGGSAVGDDGRWVIAVDGALDLDALAQQCCKSSAIRAVPDNPQRLPPRLERRPANRLRAIAAAILPWQG